MKTKFTNRIKYKLISFFKEKNIKTLDEKDIDLLCEYLETNCKKVVKKDGDYFFIENSDFNKMVDEIELNNLNSLEDDDIDILESPEIKGYLL